MTHQDFLQLSSDLQQLARLIPLHWGKIQNDRSDNQFDMFKIHSFATLENKIVAFDDENKNYFRRRWFLWKCAQCDEYIFKLNDTVSGNLNHKSQEYDIEFNGSPELQFDIKGTLIPKKFRNCIDAVIENPTEMIRFFYEKQSPGVRQKIQNRLFIIHHSFRKPEREMYLRCCWDFKQKIYSEYALKITQNSNFISYKNVKSDVIFVFENLDKTTSHSFYSIN